MSEAAPDTSKSEKPLPADALAEVSRRVSAVEHAVKSGESAITVAGIVAATVAALCALAIVAGVRALYRRFRSQETK